MRESLRKRWAVVIGLGLVVSVGCGRQEQTGSAPSADSPAALGPEADGVQTRSRSGGLPKEPDAAESLFNTYGERYALLVGVRGYGKLSGLRPLPYTENDVTELAQVLVEAGYRTENVILMTDSQGTGKPDRLPERKKILYQLQSLLRDRGKADTVLIAVAGHGVQFQGEEDSYFCPLDAEVDKRETLISMGDVYRKLEDCAASFKILLCDACREDPFSSNSRGLRMMMPVQQSSLPLPGGVAVFYSCSPGEVAYEDRDLEHGVFFNFVIDGLRGSADLDGDGQVMLPELEYHAKRRVSDYVRAEIGGRRQMPNLKGNLLGLVPLAQKTNTASPSTGTGTGMDPSEAPPPTASPEAPVTTVAQSQDTGTPIAVDRPEVTPPTVPSHPPASSVADMVLSSPLLPLPLLNKATGEIRRFDDMGWGIASLAFSPDCRWLAAGKNDRALLLFDMVEGTRADVRDKMESLGQVSCATFSPDGSRLLTGGYSGRILVWSVGPSGRLGESGQYVGQSGEVGCMAVSEDGRFVLSGGADKKLHYWDLETGRVVRVFEEFERGLEAVHFADRKMALATDGRALRHINLDTGEVIRVYQPGRGACQAADFSPDGKILVVSDGYDLLLWNTETGSSLPPCDGNEIQWSVCFTPDGKRIVSGGRGKINVWDVDTKIRTHQADLKTGSGYVQAIAVASDCQHVAAIASSAGQDLQVFRIPPPPSTAEGRSR